MHACRFRSIDANGHADNVADADTYTDVCADNHRTADADAHADNHGIADIDTHSDFDPKADIVANSRAIGKL